MTRVTLYLHDACDTSNSNRSKEIYIYIDACERKKEKKKMRKEVFFFKKFLQFEPCRRFRDFVCNVDVNGRS